MIDFDGSEMEIRARVIVGWDKGPPEESAPLTERERDYLIRDAYSCSPDYPPDEAPTGDDAALCRWWLAALKDYVDCM